MNNSIIKTISANSQIENLDHEKLHIKILMEKYPDLQVNRVGDGTVDYYSKSINNIADAILFTEINPSSYTYFHYANPFKEIKIDCLQCKEHINIKLKSIPNRIMIFNHYGNTYYSGDHLLYCAPYEDFMKQHNFSQDIIGKSHLYVLNYLNILKEKNIVISERYLNASCEKLLPFM